MLKNIVRIVFFVLIAALLVACGGGEAEGTEPPGGEAAGGTSLPETGGEEVQFSFWAAPNPSQGAFWREMSEMYMQENANVSIEVSAIPESPSSEAGIQAALAGGTAPAASENIFTGFAGELLRSQAIVPLNELEGWNEAIEARSMGQTIESWTFEDGNYYIYPLYSNAILFAWRTDILGEIGVQEPPRDYAGVLDMGQQLKEQSPDRFVWARPALAQDTWYERWFDFFTLYDAASGGQPLIEGNEITADDQAAVGVLTFLSDLAENDLLLTQEVQEPFPTGTSVMSELGPWVFTAWQEQFPEMAYNETFTLTMPPAPDGVAQEDIKTFADAKGVVIYAQASPEQQQAAFDFIRWVFSDPQHDLQWLEATSLPPARDDLAENEVFQSFFEQNPQLVPYAENIPNAVPPLRHPEFTEIQRLLGAQALNPVVTGQKEPEQAWEDWKNAIQSLLQ